MEKRSAGTALGPSLVFHEDDEVLVRAEGLADLAIYILPPPRERQGVGVTLESFAADRLVEGLDRALSATTFMKPEGARSHYAVGHFHAGASVRVARVDEDEIWIELRDDKLPLENHVVLSLPRSSAEYLSERVHALLAEMPWWRRMMPVQRFRLGGSDEN